MFSSAEETSHALMRSGSNTVFERGAAHVVGYVFDPLRRFLRYVIPKNKPYKYVQDPAKGPPGFFAESRGFPAPQIKENMSRRVQRGGIAPVRGPRLPRRGRRGKKKKNGPPGPRGQPFRAPRGRNPVRPRPKNIVSVGRRPGNVVQRKYNPPVQTSYTTRVGPMITFQTGSRPGCMIIRGTMRLGVVSSSGAGVFSMVTAGGTTVNGALPLAPQCFAFWPNSLATLASMFERYRIETRLRYIPSCPTSTAGKLGILTIKDPAAVYDVFGIVNETSGLDQKIASQNSDYMETPVFQEYTHHIQKYEPRDDMRWIAGGLLPSTGKPDYKVQGSAALRDQIQGVYLFGLGGVANSTSLGDMFVDYELELCDMVTAPTSASATAFRQRQARLQERLAIRSDDLLVLLDRLDLNDDAKQRSRSVSPAKKAFDELKE